MTTKITDQEAQSEFRTLVNRAVQHNDRFVVERNGEPAVIILSIADFIQTVAPPEDWLRKSWDSAKQQGLDQLTMDEIEAEITAARRDRAR